MDRHDGRDAACAIPVTRNTMSKAVTRPRPARKHRVCFISPPLLSLETAPFAVLPTGPESGEGRRGEHPPGMADIPSGVADKLRHRHSDAAAQRLLCDLVAGPHVQLGENVGEVGLDSP